MNMPPPQANSPTKKRLTSFAACLISSLLMVPIPVFAQIGLQPGDRFVVPVNDLPEPGDTPPETDPPKLVARQDEDIPTVPRGFRIKLFAEQVVLNNLLTLDNGTLLGADSHQNRVLAFVDVDQDGVADQQWTVATGFNRPFGMTVDRMRRHLLISDTTGVFSLELSHITPNQRPQKTRIVERGVFGTAEGHWVRNIQISSDHRWLFAGVGSRNNIREEDLPRATVMRFRVDLKGNLRRPMIFSGGLRNPIGLAIEPVRQEIWAAVDERDGMGDRLVPDFLARLTVGSFFGFPYAYLSPEHPQPGYGHLRPDLVAQTSAPDVLFQAHSSPSNLVFPTRANLPPGWRDDAFVVLRGSWNSVEPVGYHVARIPFERGRPEGRGGEIFISGFLSRLSENEEVPLAWGHPTALTDSPDGVLFLSDDGAKTLWRIEWVGEDEEESNVDLERDSYGVTEEAKSFGG